MNNSPRLGRYELIRKIAAGGMAEIFLARQWGAGTFFRDVVVKRLFRNLAEDPVQLRMFQDEARLMSNLNHPNIPQVHDLGYDEGYWYIAMEHVEGWSIADLWRQGARAGVMMPMQVAMGLMSQACEALHHAHERKDRANRPLRIVHRDVTPHNIMVTRDGVVKLMDFGVALTSARRDAEPNVMRGTLSYMAPEQVRARPLDRRADVFAVGVILYELTTGAKLYQGTDAQIMTQIVEEDVPPPSAQVPEYPPELEELVMRALERDRGRRIPSAAHISWKLEEIAQSYGSIIGTRLVARYIQQAVPAESVEEAALALVPAEDADSAQASGEEDPSILEDLNLLSLPPEPEIEIYTEPIDLVRRTLDEAPVNDDSFEKRITTVHDQDASDIDAEEPTPLRAEGSWRRAKVPGERSS